MRCVAILLVALAGCSEDAVVVPAGGLPSAMSRSGPVTMVAFADQWTGAPDDLFDYLTPIAVELYNAGPYEVRVSYADFALRDGSGYRYSAVNPFPQARTSRVDNQQELTAGRGGGGGHSGGGGHFSGHSSSGNNGGSGHVTVGPPSGHRLGGPIGIHGGWSGYHIYPGASGWYGPGWAYWAGPLSYAPWYWQWVGVWGPRYYPSERPSADVINQALPEGVLEPGGHVNGFLYFQKATDRSRYLDLGWEAHEARSGGFVAMTHVPLQVIDR